MVVKLQKRFFSVLAAIIILIAPVLVQSTACVFLWGEPDCPNCLKK